MGKEIFITSTLKLQWNKDFNPILCRKLEERDVSCYLPQRDTEQDGSSESIYRQNICGIDDAGKVLAIGKNESVNWGVEVGYAFGTGKVVVLLAEKEHEIPKMATGMFSDVLRVESLDDIDGYIEKLVEIIAGAGE